MKRLLLACVIGCFALVAGISNFPERRFGSAEASLPADSGATFSRPPNHTFHAGSVFVSGATNWDFESGLSGWVYPDGTGTGTVETVAGGQSGNYLSITDNSGNLQTRARSSEFTVRSDGTLFSFYLNTFGDSAAQGRVEISTAAGGYTNWDQRFGGGNGTATGWNLKTIDLSSFVGQSVKIRYAAYKAVGFDQGAWRNEAPNWTGSGAPPVNELSSSIPASTAGAGDSTLPATSCADVPKGSYSGPVTLLPGSSSITSSAFVVPASAETIAFRFLGEGSFPSASISFNLSSEGYSTPHEIFNKTLSNQTSVSTYCKVPESWRGQNVKVLGAASVLSPFIVDLIGLLEPIGASPEKESLGGFRAP